MDGRWVRLPQEGAGVVIFVHGILSSGETCWKHPNGTYWPTLLSEEQTLSDLGIYVYTYQTSIGSGYYSVSDVVGDLKERLKGAQAGKGTIWQGGGPMLFVCHSMGGIVARKLIVRSQMELIDVGARIGLFLVASPSLGSSYANWVTTIARAAGNTQAISLRFAQDNQWLNELDAEFQTLKESARIPMVGRELQEDKPIVRRLFRFLPQIVAPYSAHRYFGDPLKVAHSDHFSISKPADRNAFAHQVLVRFLKEAGPRLAALTPPRLREDPGTIATSSGKAGESVAPPATVAEPADDWPEEGGAAFVCVTERGSEVKTVKSFQEYCAEYGAPLPAEQSYSGFAVRGFFENGGAFAVIARAAGQGARRAQASIRLNPEGQALVVSARDVGTYGNRLQVELSSATRKGIRVRIREASVSAGAPRESLLEDFDNVRVDGGPPVLVLIEYLNRRSQWIVASVSAEPLTIQDGTPPPTGTWQLEGGADGIVTAESLLGPNEPHENPRLRSGLTGLKMSWHCGLICIPDLSQSWLKAEDRERVTAALLAHCAEEQAVAVVAAGTSNDELMRVHAPCDSAVAIAAWPWLSVFSPDNKQEMVPPDGHVAGAIARSDRRQGLHKPPTLCTLAGTLRTSPSIAATAEQRAEHGLEAERRGFNLLVMVDGKPQAFLRPLITTALAENARDPTRSRLVTWINRRIRYGLMWVPFERPSKEVEQKIVRQVDEFLHKLWKMGALGGMSPQEAYRVTVAEDASRPGYVLDIQLTFAANYERMSICYLLSQFD